MLKFTTVFAVVCLLAVSVLGTAFAAPSTSATAEVTSAVDSEGQEVNLTYSDVPTTVLLTEQIAAREVEESASELTVVWQRDITSDVLPVTITFAVDGVEADQPIYVYHYNGTSWDLVGEGQGSSITVTFTDLSPVGLVVAGTVAAGDGGTSPKTGDTDWMLYAAFAAIAIGGIAACTAYTKKKA